MIEEHIKKLHRCFRCGFCKFTSNFTDLNCPSYMRFRFETYSTGGRLWLIRAWLSGEVEWTKHLAEIIYACTTCRNCVEQCVFGFSDDIVNMIVAARSEAVEQGLVPPIVRDFLNNISKHGNPWGKARSKRAAGLKGVRKCGQQQEYLYYVGCIGSYDERAQVVAKSLAELLEMAGVAFGILGEDEDCDGNEVYMLGEIGLFQLLAERNINKFKELGVKKIVTLSPHAYNIMKNEYPKLGGHFEVLHYTQLLQELIQKGEIKLSEFKSKVTYHDPCFLGRYNGIYEPPREVLRSVPGVELVEMERNRENSFCCGGGSGNIYMDFLGGDDAAPNRIRIKEAYDTGAEVLAVACPGCMMMLEDALKEEELEDKMVVMDLSELVRDACLR